MKSEPAQYKALAPIKIFLFVQSEIKVIDFHNQRGQKGKHNGRSALFEIQVNNPRERTF